MVHNRMEKKGKEWSRVEYVTPLFRCLTSLIEKKREMRTIPSFNSNLEGQKMRALSGKGETHCPSLAIPPHHPKLLLNMVHFSLSTPPLATSSIATLPNIP